MKNHLKGSYCRIYERWIVIQLSRGYRFAGDESLQSWISSLRPKTFCELFSRLMEWGGVTLFMDQSHLKNPNASSTLPKIISEKRWGRHLHDNKNWSLSWFFICVLPVYNVFYWDFCIHVSRLVGHHHQYFLVPIHKVIFCRDHFFHSMPWIRVEVAWPFVDNQSTDDDVEGHIEISVGLLLF